MKRRCGARDAKRDIGAELLQAMRDVKAGRARPIPFRLRRWRGERPDVSAKFADMLGVSARTLQQWEQGRRDQTRRGAGADRGRPSQSKAGAHRSRSGADRSRGVTANRQDDAAQGSRRA